MGRSKRMKREPFWSAIRKNVKSALQRKLVDDNTYEYTLVVNGKHESKAHVFINRKERSAYIYSVRTSKGFMRKGFAGILINTLEQNLRNEGINEIRLHPTSHVIPMFVRRGYKPTYSGESYFKTLGES